MGKNSKKRLSGKNERPKMSEAKGGEDLRKILQALKATEDNNFRQKAENYNNWISLLRDNVRFSGNYNSKIIWSFFGPRTCSNIDAMYLLKYSVPDFVGTAVVSGTKVQYRIFNVFKIIDPVFFAVHGMAGCLGNLGYIILVYSNVNMACVPILTQDLIDAWSLNVEEDQLVLLDTGMPYTPYLEKFSGTESINVIEDLYLTYIDRLPRWAVKQYITDTIMSSKITCQKPDWIGTESDPDLKTQVRLISMFEGIMTVSKFQYDQANRYLNMVVRSIIDRVTDVEIRIGQYPIAGL